MSVATADSGPDNFSMSAVAETPPRSDVSTNAPDRQEPVTQASQGLSLSTSVERSQQQEQLLHGQDDALSRVPLALSADSNSIAFPVQGASTVSGSVGFDLSPLRQAGRVQTGRILLQPVDTNHDQLRSGVSTLSPPTTLSNGHDIGSRSASGSKPFQFPPNPVHREPPTADTVPTRPISGTEADSNSGSGVEGGGCRLQEGNTTAAATGDNARLLHAPLALSLSPVSRDTGRTTTVSDFAASPSSGQAENPAQASPRGLRGDPSDSTRTSSFVRKKPSFGLRRSIPNFLQKENHRAHDNINEDRWLASAVARESANASDCSESASKQSSQWDVSGRTFNSADDGFRTEEGLIVTHDRARARRNWRVLRSVLIALGMFRVAGLNRLRAKQLSAAEVKRGLRRNVTGGGQNIIPTMSFYAPKTADDAEASTAQYEALCDQWARFSPAIVHRMLRQRLLDDGKTEQEFTCERFSTTLLFADISGFTRLSARLNAEQLKTHTNQYFTMLIDVVARYGGDIIKFCGDAVMIIWPSKHTAPRGVLQANAMQASACALAMLNECGEYDVGKGDEAVALRLHCGMGSGDMYGYLVGTQDRWEYLVAGDPLRQIGEAEPEAKQGEVILSPESWELASTDFLATKTPQGNWLLKEPRDLPGLLSPQHQYTQQTHGPDSKSPPHADGGSRGGSGVSGAGPGTGASPTRRQRASAALAESHPNGGSTANTDSADAGTPSAKGARRHRGGASPQGPGGVGDRNPSPCKQDSAASPTNSVVGGGGADVATGEAGFRATRRRGKKDGTARKERGSLMATNGATSKDALDEDSSESYTVEHLHRRLLSLQNLTVTQSVNKSAAVSEEHRVQASEYLASYIKAQYDGGVEKSMTKLSTALRGYTQESARHAIESDTVKYLAEIRFVTTIFINIYGLEEQLKHGGGFLLQQTMQLGVGSLAKFGGVLRQFVVDDKGCVMIGAFGLPQYSYEDNEVRAISASKEIIVAFTGLNLAASIGITTGQVYCGFVGSSKRCEYAMMGCSVNLSARLMASAPRNTIQVDFEIWSRAHNFFKFETLTPIKAKGYVDPVRVFRPLGQALKDDDSQIQADADTSSGPIVGATDELDALAAAVKRLRTLGHTRPVTLLGQAGSGKTHLLRSAQVQKIWRGAIRGGVQSGRSLGDEEREGSDDREGGRRLERREETPVIITVCRNVHANTPYFIWKSILLNIFSFGHEKSQPREKSSNKRRAPVSPGASSRASFPPQPDATSTDIRQHPSGRATVVVRAPDHKPEEEPKVELTVAVTGDEGRRAKAITAGAGGGGTKDEHSFTSVASSASTVDHNIDTKSHHNVMYTVSKKPVRHGAAELSPLPGSPLGGRSMEGEGGNATGAGSGGGPAALTTGGEEAGEGEKSEEGEGGGKGGGSAGGGGEQVAGMRIRPRAIPSALKSSSLVQRASGKMSRQQSSITKSDAVEGISRASRMGGLGVGGSGENGGSSGLQARYNLGRQLTEKAEALIGGTGKASDRRPRRYDKMKRQSVSRHDDHASGIDDSEEGSAGRAGGLRQKLGDFGALAYARVSSGLRGDPDWDTTGMDPVSRNVSKRDPTTNSRRDPSSGRIFSRGDQPSRRTDSMRLTEGGVEGRPQMHRESSRMNAVVAAHLLKERNSAKMERMPTMLGANQVRGVGQATDIIRWMRRSCPDMMPMAPLLEDIMSAGFEESSMTAGLPPDVRHRNLERLVVEVVRSAVGKEEKRLLLIIEDAQWMNMHSMKLLLKLARAQLKVMIVMSARPFEEYFENVPNEVTAFRRMGPTIEMSPLSPSDCLRLARHMIGEAILSSTAGADLLPPGSDVVLHEKSGGGNPLFVRNIATTLRDNFVTTRKVTPLVDLPAGFFHSLIVSRFDALEPQEQTVLKAATVIGAAFGKRLLLHMLPSNSRDRIEILHAALLKLIEANFISRSVVGQTERFSFVHTSVQETIYKMMLTDQKENLHEICAQWHEKHHPGSVTSQSVTMHHWMRSGNTAKKVECHLLAAAKAQETFGSDDVIQHMLALLAIAFGKDMATATVISLEPFLEAAQPSLGKGTMPLPPSPSIKQTPPSVTAAGESKEQQATTPYKTSVGFQRQNKKDLVGTEVGEADISTAPRGPAPTQHSDGATADSNSRRSGGCFGWLAGGTGDGTTRRRYSSLIFPMMASLTREEADAAERRETVRTAARLGCAVGNLTARQQEMLVAKDQEWLWASDFRPCLEFSDPVFSPSMVARWIGEIGIAHLRMGRLLPAHNHMQEALVYLGFKPVPSRALPLERAACLGVECARRQPRDIDDTLFAAHLYGSIADISVKAGLGGNLSYINYLARASIRGVDCLDRTAEGIRLIVNKAQQELERGRHDKVQALLQRALALCRDIDDPVTRGIVLIASGTYNAGQGSVGEAEEDFAGAFEMFAPAGDTSRCGEVMVESAYVKLCLGDMKEALFMFLQVRGVALGNKDDFLSQTSLHGAALVYAITGNIPEATATLAQLRFIVEEDWARRRGRRGRTAAATEGTSHSSLVVMEVLGAYVATARGDGRAALKGVCRASVRLARSSTLRFSCGLFLHLTADACFTMAEQAMLPPGPEPRRRFLKAARLIVRTLGRLGQVFDLMSPLHQLGRARWNLLHGMNRVAEKALDLGLAISEEVVNFPYAEGLLLLHSTRLESLPIEERRARARRGRRILYKAGASLVHVAGAKHVGAEGGGDGVVRDSQEASGGSEGPSHDINSVEKSTAANAAASGTSAAVIVPIEEPD